MIRILYNYIMGSFKTLLLYKYASFASLFSSLVQIILLYYFWLRAYGADIETLKYVIYARIVYFLIGENNIWDFAGEIKNGDIVSKLVKPYGFLGNNLFKVFSSKIVFLIVYCIPGFALTYLFVQPSFSLLNTMLFIISIILSILICFCIDYLFSLLCIFTNNVWGISALRDGIMQICSGAIVPLYLLSHSLQTLFKILPFSYIINTPVSFLTQNCNQIDFLAQVIYSIFLLCITNITNNILMKKVKVQGG